MADIHALKVNREVTLKEFLKRCVGDRDAVLDLANDCHEEATYLRAQLAERDAQLAAATELVSLWVYQTERMPLMFAGLNVTELRSRVFTEAALDG